MAFKKKTGQYVLYAALTSLVLFIFLMYTAKPIVGEGRESCASSEYIKQTAGTIGACPSLCVEEKPRILSSGFCDWTYTCVDSSKCVGLPSPAPVTPAGPPNFKVKVLESSNKEYAEKTVISYLIQIENIGGAGVMSVESGLYKEADVRSWGYDLTTYATVSPITQCKSGETFVQRKGVTLAAGESTTANYEITVPSYENAKFILIAGSFDNCGEKYKHFDSIPVKIVKSTGGTGGTAGTTFEWPKITFLSDIGKWWNNRTTLEKSALGAFILLITIWYMFWSDFGKHSEAMKILRVKELAAKAESITGGKK